MDRQAPKWLRKLSNEQLDTLCRAVDAEMERRTSRSRPRGYVRTTYMCDIVRGKRLAEPQALPWAA